MAWTNDQKKAIAARQGNFLVAAGAGSGKTAVLTERVRQIIDNGEATINELLVLTFTNKAAHEMKSRIREAFLKEGKIAVADQVEASDITTFDAFALALVKKYHYCLGLPQDIVICDESFLGVEKRKLLDEILEKHYEAHDPKYLDFLSHYAVKDDSVLTKLVLQLHTASELSGDPEAYLQNLSNSFDPVFFSKAAEEYDAQVNDRLSRLYEAVANYDNDALADAERPFLKSLLGLGSYSLLLKAFQTANYPSCRLPKGEEISPSDKAIHTAIRTEFNTLKNEMLLYGSLEEQEKRYLSTKPYADLLIRTTLEFRAALAAYQKSKAAYSFSDIARMAAEIAEKTPVLKNHYKFIMVDEYQDTSDLQERFIESIASNNVFAVGDVKQSIYRFRHANPKIFMQKYDDYAKRENGSLITMRDNFRSRQEIIQGVNELFSKTMSPSLGEIQYDENQSLTWGNHEKYSSSAPYDYQPEILTYVHSSLGKAPEEEAALIANDILEKLNQGFKVSRHGVLMPVRWGDFAILISRKRDFGVYERIFAEAKIPLLITEDKNLASEDVSLAFLSFIRLTCLFGSSNEAGEKHAYASIKRSYLFGEKDADIFQEIQTGSYRNDPLMLLVASHRDSWMTNDLYVSIKDMMDSLPFVERLPYLGEVKSNYEKLLSFLNCASLAERLGFSFDDFADHFNDLNLYGVSYSAPSGEEEGDSVKLMTIHASKGLEFPIVYCPDLSAKANLSDQSGGFIIDEKYGILLPSPQKQGDPYTFLYSLAKSAAQEAILSERMRLFYVALTRAEEKLILVARKTDIEASRLGPATLLFMKEKKDKNGDMTFSSSLRPPLSFLDFLRLSDQKLSHFSLREAEIKPLSSSQKSASPQAQEISCPDFRSISIPYEKNLTHRASERQQAPDKGELAYGTQLHRLLELVDFKTKDTSFVHDDKKRAALDRLLSLSIFKIDPAAKIYHEYAFSDEKQGVHGAIDLLIVSSSEASIIDFKTKNIEEKAYLSQLQVYRTYVARVFKRSVRTYLVSVLEGTMKEVQ